MINNHARKFHTKLTFLYIDSKLSLHFLYLAEYQIKKNIISLLLLNNKKYIFMLTTLNKGKKQHKYLWLTIVTLLILHFIYQTIFSENRKSKSFIESFRIVDRFSKSKFKRYRNICRISTEISVEQKFLLNFNKTISHYRHFCRVLVHMPNEICSSAVM